MIQRSNELGAQLKGLPPELPSLTRELLEQRMESWKTQAVEVEADLLAVQPENEARGEAAYLATAMHARVIGFQNFKQALVNATEGVPSDQVTGQLLNAMADFETSDRDYSYFADQAARRLRETHEEKVEIPVSSYMKDSPYSGDQAAKFVKTVQGQARLAPIHDLSIAQIATKPAAAGKVRDMDLLPASGSFTVLVTVANEGNLPERDIVVKLRLTAETQPQPQDAQDTVTALEPGGKKVLTFTQFNPARGGEAKNTLTVEIDPVGGERNQQNNRKDYNFAMRG